MAGSSCDGLSSPSVVVWFTLCAESRVGWSSPPCHVHGGGCASGTYQVVYRPAFWICYLASVAYLQAMPRKQIELPQRRRAALSTTCTLWAYDEPLRVHGMKQSLVFIVMFGLAAVFSMGLLRSGA